MDSEIEHNGFFW